MVNRGSRATTSPPRWRSWNTDPPSGSRDERGGRGHDGGCGPRRHAHPARLLARCGHRIRPPGNTGPAEAPGCHGPSDRRGGAVRCGRPAAAVRSRAHGRAHSSSAPPGCSTDCRAQRIGVGAIVSPSDIRGLACSPMSSMPEPAPSGPRPAIPPIATYSSNWSVAGTARRRPQGSPGPS